MLLEINKYPKAHFNKNEFEKKIWKIFFKNARFRGNLIKIIANRIKHIN